MTNSRESNGSLKRRLILISADYKMEKSPVRNFMHPPPSRHGKSFHAPLFKEWKLFAPPPLQYG